MLIQYPWDLIRCLSNRLVIDCAEPCSRDLDDKSIHPCAHLEGDQSIHIAPTARIGPSTVLDATAGPILIDDNTVVSPHVLIEGPAYIGPYSRINPHAHLHGGVAIGPHCKVGGEIDACIFHSYSNKQHAGFLGHAYVGSWVNLGAGTTNSDLKNTYGPIRASHRGTECDTGMQFFGATIADHVKTGINQSIPTGASFEFAAMIATSSMAPKHIPPASWLTPNSQTTGDPDRLLATAKKMAARRNVNFSPDEETLFKLRCRQA
jgi:UDP-N-acetylglucosamine diphosphorylase/glucosamine-1-phosphate N-acetyltransferase